VERKKLLVILLAYVLVVLIWSTTPLAIKWSSEGVGFLLGLTARMYIGALLSLVLVIIIYKKLRVDARAVHVYFASGLAIYGGMMPVYWGAQYIDSGLISVVFSLTPIVTAFLAARFLYEQSLTIFKMIGSVLGVLGLVVIFSDQISFGEQAILGISAVVLSVVLHSISSVWIKYLKPDLPVLMITAGGLLCSLPLFLLTYYLLDVQIPEAVSLRPLLAIVYLGIMGSVVGFMSYYFILVQLPASTVALITLITPVLALLIGVLFNNELVSYSIILGAVCVLTGLLIHQWGAGIVKKLCALR